MKTATQKNEHYRQRLAQLNQTESELRELVRKKQEIESDIMHKRRTLRLQEKSVKLAIDALGE